MVRATPPPFLDYRYRRSCSATSRSALLAAPSLFSSVASLFFTFLLMAITAMESMTFGLMQGKVSESFFMAEPLVEAKPFIMAEVPGHLGHFVAKDAHGMSH